MADPSTTIGGLYSYMQNQDLSCPQCRTITKEREARYRYHAGFVVSHQGLIKKVSVFGDTLNPFFGASATEMMRRVLSLPVDARHSEIKRIFASFENIALGSTLALCIKEASTKRRAQRRRKSNVTVGDIDALADKMSSSMNLSEKKQALIKDRRRLAREVQIQDDIVVSSVSLPFPPLTSVTEALQFADAATVQIMNQERSYFERQFDPQEEEFAYSQATHDTTLLDENITHGDDILPMNPTTSWAAMSPPPTPRRTQDPPSQPPPSNFFETFPSISSSPQTPKNSDARPFLIDGVELTPISPSSFFGRPSATISMSTQNPNILPQTTQSANMADILVPESPAIISNTLNTLPSTPRTPTRRTGRRATRVNHEPQTPPSVSRGSSFILAPETPPSGQFNRTGSSNSTTPRRPLTQLRRDSSPSPPSRRESIIQASPSRSPVKTQTTPRKQKRGSGGLFDSLLIPRASLISTSAEDLSDILDDEEFNYILSSTPKELGVVPESPGFTPKPKKALFASSFESEDGFNFASQNSTASLSKWNESQQEEEDGEGGFILTQQQARDAGFGKRGLDTKYQDVEDLLSSLNLGEGSSQSTQQTQPQRKDSLWGGSFRSEDESETASPKSEDGFGWGTSKLNNNYGNNYGLFKGRLEEEDTFESFTQQRLEVWDDEKMVGMFSSLAVE
ncbi:hypothetical protein HDV05_005996 [Chytridiales sp. JEL 0842]|nr:hypothetical protein HDV05_005996 [Chytridiales sp. JEL 0842]